MASAPLSPCADPSHGVRCHSCAAASRHCAARMRPSPTTRSGRQRCSSSAKSVDTACHRGPTASRSTRVSTRSRRLPIDSSTPSLAEVGRLDPDCGCRAAGPASSAACTRVARSRSRAWTVSVGPISRTTARAHVFPRRGADYSARQKVVIASSTISTPLHDLAEWHPLVRGVEVAPKGACLRRMGARSGRGEPRGLHRADAGVAARAPNAMRLGGGLLHPKRGLFASPKQAG